MLDWLDLEILEKSSMWMISVAVLLTVLFFYVRKVFLLSDKEPEIPQGELEDSKEDVEEEPLDEEPLDEEPLELSSSAAPGDSKENYVEQRPVSSVNLKEALSNTRSNLFGRIKNVFSSSSGNSDEDLEALEEVLYTSDLGASTVQKLMEGMTEKLNSQEQKDFEKVRLALKHEMLEIFAHMSVEEGLEEPRLFAPIEAEKKPLVWMIVGVNGAGKTTTIGKLSHKASSQGQKVMVVAGDTFRAAAGDQLQVWAERAQVDIFSPDGVSDPSAVVYDGYQKAKAQGYDLVIVDTAGRLHTQDNLMEELKKMKRVLQKLNPEAPHEVLIVLDSNSGQNALMQAEKFNEALGLTGAILTKLDGSAKGGVAVGLASQYKLPIKVIGVGEGVADLRPFNSIEFVDSIL